jgi:CheY-like chemotaxis protein
MASVSPPRRRILVVDDDPALRHAVAALLDAAGCATAQAGDGREALARLHEGAFDLVLLDIGLPGMSGLDVLAEVRKLAHPPHVVIMTADDTPQTLLLAVRGQAHRYIRKPLAPARIVDGVLETLHAPAAASLPIEVVSALPEWLELVAPCSREVADRIHDFVMQLDMGLSEDVRHAVGQAFRELLMNAVEWGGRLDPTRTVRISCLRTRRMLLYRIADPGEGFDMDQLSHAAVSNPADDPFGHARVREAQGLRPGGLGLLMSQALVDEIVFNEKRNDVVLIKYLD